MGTMGGAVSVRAVEYGSVTIFTFIKGIKGEKKVVRSDVLNFLNLFEVLVLMHIRHGIMKLLARPIPSHPTSPQAITNEGTLGAIRTAPMQ